MNAARYIITPLTEKDLPEAFIVSALAFPDIGEDWRAVAESARQNWRNWGKRWAEWLAAQRGSAMWAAKETATGAIIGYARCARDLRHKTEYLTDLYVLPQWQGAGLGTLLLQKVMPRRVESGWTRVIVSTENPAARRLYAQWGVQSAAIVNQYTAGLVFLPEKRHDVQILRVNSVIWEQRKTDILQFYETMRGPFSFPVFDLYLQPNADILLALTHDGVICGCGARMAECIGPAVAGNDEILQLLLDALLLSARNAALDYCVFWAPEHCSVLARYLRKRGLRFIKGDPSVILTSSVADFARLNQSLIVAPPYLL